MSFQIIPDWTSCPCIPQPKKKDNKREREKEEEREREKRRRLEEEEKKQETRLPEGGVPVPPLISPGEP
jgi:hypothetical protein